MKPEGTAPVAEGARQSLTLRALPDQPGMFRGDFTVQRFRREALATGMDLAATGLCGWFMVETTTDFLTNMP